MAPPTSAPSLSANIRLGWKWLIVTVTLTYCSTELITALKSFMIKPPGFRTWFLSSTAQFYKTFFLLWLTLRCDKLVCLRKSKTWSILSFMIQTPEPLRWVKMRVALSFFFFKMCHKRATTFSQTTPSRKADTHSEVSVMMCCSFYWLLFVIQL